RSFITDGERKYGTNARSEKGESRVGDTPIGKLFLNLRGKSFALASNGPRSLLLLAGGELAESRRTLLEREGFLRFYARDVIPHLGESARVGRPAACLARRPIRPRAPSCGCAAGFLSPTTVSPRRPFPGRPGRSRGHRRAA